MYVGIPPHCKSTVGILRARPAVCVEKEYQSASRAYYCRAISHAASESDKREKGVTVMPPRKTSQNASQKVKNANSNVRN
jgi:hypothetical protein